MLKFRIENEISNYKINFFDLEKIKQIKGSELPEDYKEFLLTNNGGEPSQDCDTFEIKNYSSNHESGFDSVRMFYGICDENQSVMYTYDIFNKMKIRYNRVPHELLPIANDSFGNEVCLCVKGKNYGKIFFWDHDNEAMAQSQSRKPWWNNIYEVARSFTEFTKSLHKYDLDENGKAVRTYQDGTVIHSL